VIHTFFPCFYVGNSFLKFFQAFGFSLYINMSGGPKATPGCKWAWHIVFSRCEAISTSVTMITSCVGHNNVNKPREALAMTFHNLTYNCTAFVTWCVISGSNLDVYCGFQWKQLLVSQYFLNQNADYPVLSFESNVNCNCKICCSEWLACFTSDFDCW